VGDKGQADGTKDANRWDPDERASILAYLERYAGTD
jgi:hypothetical protein